ncbi:MAG: ABC transporter ATP-binding protein [Traorella sp.]
MKTILKVENLCKKIDQKEIIKNISFHVDEGEIVALVGENGAGKSTTFKLLSNLIFPDSGHIYIHGYDLLHEREKALSCASFMIENPGLFEDLSGKENLEIVRVLYHKNKEDMKEIIDFTGLDYHINKKVKKYSVGMKQRLMLGMCLLSSPKLLVLDEPTNGLDPSGIIEFRKKILQLAHEKKMAILISSHILQELEKICDRYIFIKEGELVESKVTKDIEEEYKRIYL